ncbi:MAG: Holliday junction branch migration protein RuvA [Bacteroidales bacterium]
MYEYISGSVNELTPTYVVLDNGGVGYMINITLTSYSYLQSKSEAKLYIFEAIREDAHLLYGFAQKRERELFLLLISVSGVGANTARMILSSISTAELEQTIATENVNLLKAVKGIGAKTAQRIIVDLKDKIKCTDSPLIVQVTNTSVVCDEAVAALVMLGFAQNQSLKVVKQLLASSPNMSVEVAIKNALKMM